MAEGKKSANNSKKRKKKPDIIIEKTEVKEKSSDASKKKSAASASDTGQKKQRDERGRFVKGHTPLEGAGFQPGNVESLKYDPKYPEDMKLYFKQVSTEGNYPTFENYADSIDVTVRTLENWCEAYPLFKDAYDACKNLQKGTLIEGAMLGRYNPTFAKFVAVNCHGMKEKVESEVKGSGGFNISIGYFEGEEDK